MKTHVLAAAVVVLASTGASAFAADANVVNFTLKADQQSLRDPSRQDLFNVGLTDAKVESELSIKCQAGHTGWIKRTDEACSVTGNGLVVGGGKKLPRTQYQGGWVVKADGFTEGGTMSVNYLAVGSVAASQANFGGSMMLKPKNPSSGFAVLQDAILKKINASTDTTNGVIDQQIDPVQFSGLFIPSAGLPSDKGCTWNGNMAFAYQTNSWIMDLKAQCSGKDFALKGNMPWTDTPGVANQTQYNLTLTLPSAAISSDAALFADAASGDNQMFAQADGISGQIIMKQSNVVHVTVDGKDTEVPVNIDATGSFTGQNVPLETVRSLATLIGIMSRTFFGA